MARLAEPLMKEGGTLFAMSFYGAHRVVAPSNLMGPVKAALEASGRYLASELGAKESGFISSPRAAHDARRLR